MVSGMNNLWNSGRKEVILATAKTPSEYPQNKFKLGNKAPSVFELQGRYGIKEPQE